MNSKLILNMNGVSAFSADDTDILIIINKKPLTLHSEFIKELSLKLATPGLVEPKTVLGIAVSVKRNNNKVAVYLDELRVLSDEYDIYFIHELALQLHNTPELLPEQKTNLHELIQLSYNHAMGRFGSYSRGVTDSLAVAKSVKKVIGGGGSIYRVNPPQGSVDFLVGTIGRQTLVSEYYIYVTQGVAHIPQMFLTPPLVSNSEGGIRGIYSSIAQLELVDGPNGNLLVSEETLMTLEKFTTKKSSPILFSNT